MSAFGALRSGPGIMPVDRAAGKRELHLSNFVNAYYELRDLEMVRAGAVLGSVHDMAVFANASFDAVPASHMLEHLPAECLDAALREIARVGSHALVHLPVAGRHPQLRLSSEVCGLDPSLRLDVHNWLHRPDGREPRYVRGMHYCEVGRRGLRVRELLRRFALHFEVLPHYRNRDWLPGYSFVLRSREAG